jgi:hypothetical protein
MGHLGCGSIQYPVSNTFTSVCFNLMDMQKNHISGNGSLGSGDHAEKWLKMA